MTLQRSWYIENIKQFVEINIGYSMLINAMAFAVEMGFQPYATILPDESYRVYYDFKNGKGKCRNFKLEELVEASEWIKHYVQIEIQNNPKLIKTMYITPEERV